YTKFTRAAFAQCAHQLPQFRHTLAQPFGVANQIAGNRKLAVPVPARNTGIMIWQMNQACVPTKYVEALCATSITIDARRHQRVQNENGRCVPTVSCGKEIRVRNVVRRKLSL